MPPHIVTPTTHGQTFNRPVPPPPDGVADRPFGKSAPPIEPTAVVRCVDLSLRTDDTPTIDSVSFTVHTGETFGIFGADATARTALIGMVCGLLRPDAGSVYLLGRPLHRLEPIVAHARIGYVRHSAVVLPTGTIGDNLEIWARIGGISAAEQQVRTAEALAKVGLAIHRDDPVAGCTSGTLRELSLASALLHRPRLLVMDQPIHGLEPRGRARLLATLGGLRAEGVAAVYFGRSAADAPGLCSRIRYLEGGRLTTAGHLVAPASTT